MLQPGRDLHDAREVDDDRRVLWGAVSGSQLALRVAPPTRDAAVAQKRAGVLNAEREPRSDAARPVVTGSGARHVTAAAVPRVVRRIDALATAAVRKRARAGPSVGGRWTGVRPPVAPTGVGAAVPPLWVGAAVHTAVRIHEREAVDERGAAAQRRRAHQE